MQGGDTPTLWEANATESLSIDVTDELVHKDDDNWYPQLRLHYFLTLGREQLVVRVAAPLELRDAKRAKSQIETAESTIWKSYFNKGQ